MRKGCPNATEMSRSQAIVDGARKWRQDALAGRYDAAARELINARCWFAPHRTPSRAVPIREEGGTRPTPSYNRAKRLRAYRAALSIAAALGRGNNHLQQGGRLEPITTSAA